MSHARAPLPALAPLTVVEELPYAEPEDLLALDITPGLQIPKSILDCIPQLGVNDRAALLDTYQYASDYEDEHISEDGRTVDWEYGGTLNRLRFPKGAANELFLRIAKGRLKQLIDDEVELCPNFRIVIYYCSICGVVGCKIGPQIPIIVNQR